MSPLVPLTHDRDRLRPLFDGFPGLHGAIDAVVEGVNGAAFADDATSPRVAKLVLGDFHMVAGDPDAAAARPALESVPGGDFLAVHEAWEGLIWDSGRLMQPNDRFAFRAPEAWDRERLRALRASLPEGLVLERVSAKRVAAFEGLNESFTGNFRSIEEFLEVGVGFGIRERGSDAYVAGCSSYTISSRSVEFEIETREDFQRRGLALVTGAALIEYCIERGLEACWDAAHAGSAVLAERLGFVGRHEYLAYRME